jgi:hypothetical protein
MTTIGKGDCNRDQPRGVVGVEAAMVDAYREGNALVQSAFPESVPAAARESRDG